MELYRDMFMKCLSLHSADIAQDHRWYWTYLCGKQIQGNVILLRAKNMVQIKHLCQKCQNIFFMHALKNILLHLQNKLTLIITTFLWLISSFDSVIATLFFLVITGIVLSRSSYFKLVFPLIFSYTSRGTLSKISTFRNFFRLSPPSEI